MLQHDWSDIAKTICGLFEISAESGLHVLVIVHGLYLNIPVYDDCLPFGVVGVLEHTIPVNI